MTRKEYDEYVRDGEEPPPDVVDASVMADFRRLRQRGHSLKSLVLSDLEAHEDICEWIAEASAARKRKSKS